MKFPKAFFKKIPKPAVKELHKNLFDIEKRIRFVASSLVLTAVMFVISSVFFSDSIWIVAPIFLALTYALTYLSILEGIEKGEWLMLFIMPVILSLSFYMISLLFPPLLRYRAPIVLLYGFSIYASLLTSNIFNVGVEKSLQLFRAAFSVNYFFHALTSFMLTSVILSFKLPVYVNSILLFMIYLPLSVQLFWSVKPKNEISEEVKRNGLLTTFLIVQLSVMLSFLPFELSVVSLLLTATYYCITGLMFHQMEGRLFKQTIREYIFVLVFVMGIALLSIRW